MVISNIFINGLIVVKKPQFNFDPLGRRVFNKEPPKIGEILYGGIGRECWFEIEEEDINKTLPEEINLLYKTYVDIDINDEVGLQICQNENAAIKLLKYSNKSSETNEIIAVSGKILSELVGTMKLSHGEIEWIGYEPISLGHLSLIESGVFKENTPLSIWEPYLNEHGLFDDPQMAETYAQDYLAKADDVIIEMIPTEEDPIDIIRVGKVHYQEEI